MGRQRICLRSLLFEFIQRINLVSSPRDLLTTALNLPAKSLDTQSAARHTHTHRGPHADTHKYLCADTHRHTRTDTHTRTHRRRHTRLVFPSHLCLSGNKETVPRIGLSDDRGIWMCENRLEQRTAGVAGAISQMTFGERDISPCGFF